MTILTFPLGPLDTNCFLLLHEGKAIVIDPGGEPQPLIDALKEQKCTTRIFC